MRLPSSYWLSLAIYLSLNYLMESCITTFFAVIIISFQYGTQYAHIFAFLEIVNFLFTHPRNHLNLINSTDVISLIVFIIVTATIITLTEYYKKTLKENKNNTSNTLIMLPFYKIKMHYLCQNIGNLLRAMKLQYKKLKFNKTTLSIAKITTTIKPSPHNECWVAFKIIFQPQLNQNDSEIILLLAINKQVLARLI